MMKWIMTMGIGVLFAAMPLLAQAAEPVECENDYGSATVRDGSYSFECNHGDAGDGGSSDITADMETCMELLEQNCGGGDADCTLGNSYSYCESEVGGCFEVGNSYECYCFDGSKSDCAPISRQQAEQPCQQLSRDACPAVEVDDRCVTDRGACWVYPAGFVCQCKIQNRAGLGNLGDPGDAANYLSDKSCGDLVATFCEYEGEYTCPTEHVDACVALARAQLDCAEPVAMQALFDYESCCRLRANPDAAEFLACVEREACNDPISVCETLHPNYDPNPTDGDMPSDGDSLADGDTPDGDAADGDDATDSEEDGDAADSADGDDGGKSGATDDDGGCRQTNPGAGVAWLLLMLAVVARRRKAWSRL